MQEQYEPSSPVSSRNFMISMISSGLSQETRPRIWLELTGASYLLTQNPLYYSTLLDDTQLLSSACSKQIERDLLRTFPDDPFFSLPSIIQSLRRILTAYAWRNPNVGYCQGMNFIVGILLSIGLSEHEAFWVMVQIVEKYLPIDYFSVMSGVMVDQEIFTFLIKLKLPKMYRHMRRLEVDPSHFSVQWFVCIFAYNLSRDVVIRLWDIFFVEGCCFLFKVAMAIMTLAEKPMISLTDSCKRYLDDALSFMDKFTKSIKTPSKLIKLVQNSDLDLTDYKLSILRRRFRPNIDKEIDSKLKSVIQTSPKENKEFIQSLKIPCKNHDECRYRSRRTSSYFIFNSSQFQIVENYLDSLTVLPYFNTQHLRDSVPTTLLGHKNHLCSYESLFSIHETEDKETNSHE